MTAKKTGFIESFKRWWPYLVATACIFALAFFGSLDKSIDDGDSLNLESIANNNFSISADQVSEFYMVAELAESMKLSSSSTITNNYISVSVLQQDSQQIDDSGKISKPITVDTSHLTRGVRSYTVQPGETLDTIAAKYGITVDDIRWSNNLRNNNIAEFQQILIPSTHGIAYTVKENDTVESLANKYGSNASNIIAFNDLETRSLAPGMVIVLPSGVLPERERPEYVAPSNNYGYSYSYNNYRSNGARENLQVIDRWSYGRSLLGDGNSMVPGQCTWYAWYWRKHYSNRPLPSGPLGNANAWASTLSRRGYVVNRTPSVGAIFQTSAGYYGHVGIVTEINADGSLTVQEMNYSGAYVVTRSRIPASAVGSYNYIH